MYVSRVLTQNLTQWTVLSGTAGRGSCQAIHQIIGFLVKVGTFLFLSRSHKCCCLPLNKQAMDDRQPSFVAPLGLTLGILPQLWTFSRLLTLLSFDNSQLFRCTIHSLSSACDVVVYPARVESELIVRLVVSGIKREPPMTNALIALYDFFLPIAERLEACG